MGGYSPNSTEYTGKVGGFKVVGFDFSDGGMVVDPNGGFDRPYIEEQDEEPRRQRPIEVVTFEMEDEPEVIDQKQKQGKTVRRADAIDQKSKAAAEEKPREAKPAKVKKTRELPKREFTAVEDTSTYKLLKGIGHFKLGSIVTVIVIVTCVVLGIVCVMRYASIFDLTRHTRQIEKENAKQRNKITVESSSVDTGDSLSVDSIAAKLGMVRPSEESIITIPLSGSDVTRVYLAADEAEPDDEEQGFYQNLLSFLGRTRFD